MIDPQLPFSPAVLQTFYARVLQFDHWQNESQALSDTIRADLETFLKNQARAEEADAWKDIRHPDTLQVVSLKLFQDLEDLVFFEHVARQKSGDEVRTLKISEQQILALIMNPAGSLEVKVYPNLALVWGARLKPVAPVSHLHYGPDLELLPDVRQILEGSLMTTHAFAVDYNGVHGLVTRGHTFQKFETFIRARLPETQDLFSSLKKLERHFINPQTDPYYQELVTKLERANRILSGNPSPDGLAEAERALNRGRMSLKSIFPNDRLLTLLVTHLDYGITQKRGADRLHPT
jgi:hypothetical protein